MAAEPTLPEAIVATEDPVAVDEAATLAPTEVLGNRGVLLLRLSASY